MGDMWRVTVPDWAQAMWSCRSAQERAWWKMGLTMGGGGEGTQGTQTSPQRVLAHELGQAVFQLQHSLALGNLDKAFYVLQLSFLI